MLVGHPDGSVDVWTARTHLTYDATGAPELAEDRDPSTPPPARPDVHGVDGVEIAVGGGRAIVDGHGLRVVDDDGGERCAGPPWERRGGVALAADGDRLVIAADQGVVLVDAKTCAAVAAGGPRSPVALAIAGDVLWTSDGSVRLTAMRLPTFAPVARIDRVGFGIRDDDDGVRVSLSSIWEKASVDPETGEVRRLPLEDRPEAAVARPDLPRLPAREHWHTSADFAVAATVEDGEVQVYASRSGERLWTWSAPDGVAPASGDVAVGERTVVVRRKTETLVFGFDGALRWTVTPTPAAPGIPEGVVVTTPSGSCRVTIEGSTGCPQTTWSRAPKPPRVPPPPADVLAAKVEAWKAAVPGPEPDPALPPVPAVPTGGAPLPDRACERVPVDAFGSTALRLPLRDDRPTLVLTSPPSKLWLPTTSSYDLLLLGDLERLTALGEHGGEAARLPSDPPRRADVQDVVWAPKWALAMEALGLAPDEGVLVGPRCAVLARGTAAGALDAAGGLGLDAVDRPLPTAYAPVRFATTEHAYARAILDDGGYVWSDGDHVGVVGPDGLDRWRLDRKGGASTVIVAQGELWVSPYGGPIERLDLATGATLTKLEDGSTLRKRVADALVTDGPGDVVRVLDAATLAPRFAVVTDVAGADDRRLLVTVGPFTCGYALTDGAPTGCSPTTPAPKGVALGDLTLTVEGGDLVARRGEEVRWSIAGAAAVLPLTDDRARVQLGSPAGPWAVVDADGHLLAWIPGGTLTQVAGRHAISTTPTGLVGWEIP